TSESAVSMVIVPAPQSVLLSRFVPLQRSGVSLPARLALCDRSEQIAICARGCTYALSTVRFLAIQRLCLLALTLPCHSLPKKLLTNPFQRWIIHYLDV